MRGCFAAWSEFYLAHKIVMDVSFHIEFGIFIPHTATKANQAP
jgi:5-dehydro-2-deoxygluconokinase